MKGEHYCEEHQGNHSQYDKKNCLVCQLTEELSQAKKEITDLEDRVRALRRVAGLDAEVSDLYHMTATEVKMRQSSDKEEIIKIALERIEKLEKQPLPSSVQHAANKLKRIQYDFDNFDGDRRGIGDALEKAERELVGTILSHMRESDGY